MVDVGEFLSAMTSMTSNDAEEQETGYCSPAPLGHDTLQQTAAERESILQKSDNDKSQIWPGFCHPPLTLELKRFLNMSLNIC